MSATSEETQAFVGIVAQIRELETPVMQSDFSADLRSRLMQAAPEYLTAAAVPSRTRRRRATPIPVTREPVRLRVLRVLAATCVFVGVAAGTAAASQSALPGDPLYPVKRAIEQVNVATAGSLAERGQDLIDQAGTRLAEVKGLTGAHSNDPATTPLIEQTLQDFKSQANAGAQALMDAYRDEESSVSINVLRTFTSDSVNQLADLSKVVPTNANDDLSHAVEALSTIDTNAQQACFSCSDLPQLDVTANLIDLESSTQGPAQPTVGSNPAQTPQGSGPLTTQDPQLTSGSEAPGAVPPAGTTAPAPGDPTDPATQATDGVPPTDQPTTGPGGIIAPLTPTLPAISDLPATTDPQTPTDAPTVTEMLTPTLVPTPTDPPTPTDVPTPTDPPTVTDVPTPTDPPTGTEEPTTTDPATGSSNPPPDTAAPTTQPTTSSEPPTASVPDPSPSDPSATLPSVTADGELLP